MDIDSVDLDYNNKEHCAKFREGSATGTGGNEVQITISDRIAGGHLGENGGRRRGGGQEETRDLKLKVKPVDNIRSKDDSCSGYGNDHAYDEYDSNFISDQYRTQSHSHPISAFVSASASASERESRGRGQGRKIPIGSLLSASLDPSHSSTSSPSVSPATPCERYEYIHNDNDHHHSNTPSPYTPESGSASASIYSPVPLVPPLSYRPRSSLGSSTTIRPIRRPSSRPGPLTPHSFSFNSSRSRASPYTLPGLGINMLNSPSASTSPSPMASPQHQPLGAPLPALGSPGSMSARRRAPIPQWPSAKSSRSHSFNSAQQTPRDLYQTLKTPAALRVPPTAAFQGQQQVQQQHASVPIRGIPPNTAPPLSAARIESAPQVPTTPGRIWLLDVPKAQVIKTLNERAAKYWFKPSSADCNLYIPVSRRKYAPPSPAQSPDEQSGRGKDWPFCPSAPFVPEGIDPEASNIVTSHQYHNGRRGSLPQDDDVPMTAWLQTDPQVMVFPVHRDYLVTQSRLLRAVFTAQSPTRATFPTSPTTPQARSFPAVPPSKNPLPPKTVKGARILPPKKGEPISIFLPVPDPASIGIVLHWLYWGDAVSLEKSFSKGMATWQGVVKNIEYLALDDNIKRVMGKWWRTWVKTDVGRTSSASTIADPTAARSITSDGLPQKSSSRTNREFSVASSEDTTDDEREEDGMEVDEREHKAVGEDDDGGVGDLLKRL